MSVIDNFGGAWRFLSNFYAAEIPWQGRLWPSVEHAFQAAKTLSYSEQEEIRRAATPGKAKRLGRKVQLRDDWEDIKVDAMRELVHLKFHSHEDLARWLLDTGDAELIEGNHWHDCFWGVCQGRGENWLGRILMEVRDELKEMHDA